MRQHLVQIQPFQHISSSWNCLIIVLPAVKASFVPGTRYVLSTNVNQKSKIIYLEVEVMITIPWPFMLYIFLMMLVLVSVNSSGPRTFPWPMQSVTISSVNWLWKNRSFFSTVFFFLKNYDFLVVCNFEVMSLSPCYSDVEVCVFSCSFSPRKPGVTFNINKRKNEENYLT